MNTILSTLCLFVIINSCCVGEYYKKTDANYQQQVPDTLSVLLLSNEIYGKNEYKLLYVSFDSERVSIQVMKNNKIQSSIHLPSPDIVKNFVVNGIDETKNGFKIFVEWGGGYYFYSRMFYFQYIEEDFHLINIDLSFYDQNNDHLKNFQKKYILL